MKGLNGVRQMSKGYLSRYGFKNSSSFVVHHKSTKYTDNHEKIFGKTNLYKNLEEKDGEKYGHECSCCDKEEACKCKSEIEGSDKE